MDRKYYFKSSDKLERRRVLLSGGLNRESRRLLRQMKMCVVVLQPMPAAAQPDSEISESGE